MFADKITLETERLVLRKPQPEHWPVMRDFYLSPRSSFVGGPKDEAASWRGFSAEIGHWAMRGFGGFIAETRDTGRIIGRFGPYQPIDWPEAEIGWVLWDAEAEGKGYAFEAAQATLGYAFKVLGWTTAVSYIDAANTASIALAERLGAKLDLAARLPAHHTEALRVYRHSGEIA